MAKYFVNCSDCGESMEINLTGPYREREYKLENYSWICDDCKENAREAENKKAKEKNARAGLPALKGTERQVPWAETIRAATVEEEGTITFEKVEKFRDETYRILDWMPAMINADHDFVLTLKEFSKELFDAGMARMREVTDAGWWIDNCNRGSIKGVLRMMQQVERERTVDPARFDGLKGLVDDWLLEKIKANLSVDFTVEIRHETRTPLHWACERHRVEAVKAILELGINTSLSCYQSLIKSEIKNDTDVEIVKLLLATDLPVSDIEELVYRKIRDEKIICELEKDVIARKGRDIQRMRDAAKRGM